MLDWIADIEKQLILVKFLVLCQSLNSVLEVSFRALNKFMDYFAISRGVNWILTILLRFKIGSIYHYFVEVVFAVIYILDCGYLRQPL